MADAPNTRRIHGFCSLCVSRCGTIATVENSRFTRLDRDPGHPTGQAICAKGRAAPELVYHPERLTHPLRRTRPKGDADPGWERISWDAALDLTAAAMRRIANEHGPQSMAFNQSSPSSTAVGDTLGFMQRLAYAFGTPNRYTSTDICGWGRARATSFVYGTAGVATGAGGAMAEIASSGCLILWGYNPSYSRLSHATAAAKAQQRGMRLIVIDPRNAGLAGRADIWLRLRPGTDGALALGLANIMIERGWYDAAFMRAWSNAPLLVRNDNGRFLTEADVLSGGSARRYFAWDSAAGHAVTYDAATGRHAGDPATLALEGSYRIATAAGELECQSAFLECQPAFTHYAALCRRYPPETVEATCWIARGQIEETARMIWESRPVSYYAWSGHEQHANVTQTARALALLYALTGCFDAPGGNVVLPSVASAPITGEDLLIGRTLAPALGAGERPIGLSRDKIITARELYRAILESKPYPVRGLIGFGANLLLAQADGTWGRRALGALDFYAQADLFMTPTAAMADIVLPVASAFECEALRFGFEVGNEAQSVVQLRPAVVPPPGEARSDIAIVLDLACRLGYAEQFWNGDIDAAFRHQLAPSGISLEALRTQTQGVRVPLVTRYRKYAESDAQGNPRGFATPSRLVELYSETFLDNGYPPLPEFAEPRMGPVARPDLAGRYPLVLTCAKSARFCQSQHRALSSLRRQARDPTVSLHPDAARTRGIAEGEWVAIETTAGRVRARARFDAALDPRVAVGEHGWWQGCAELGIPGYDPFGPEGANFNLLIGSDIVDPVSGTASHRAYLCDIRPYDQVSSAS
ncbi:MAG: molybdopterin-dependent oxidoreductase [Rhodocyclaceae bacterium]|nr:molybdopterin-dependent oxidoreductase [Rhodocyclaceae bacterium]